MRFLAGSVLLIISFLSAGCAVVLQPSQQGEWSNVHNDKHKNSATSTPGTGEHAEK